MIGQILPVRSVKRMPVPNPWPTRTTGGRAAFRFSASAVITASGGLWLDDTASVVSSDRINASSCPGVIGSAASSVRSKARSRARSRRA
ncbi:MAG: hypothetical protein V9G22_14895 [Ottowia sp.]